MSFSQRRSAFFGRLGPGLITGAADDDPSGIATYSQAGAQFGFGLLWTLVLTYPLMSAIQLVNAHIGRVTGQGLARNMRTLFWAPAVNLLVGLLFIANTINIGADIAAMGEAGELVTGLSGHVLTIGFATLSVLRQLYVPYHRYAPLLKWLTLSLFAYVALVLILKLDWAAIASGLFWPRIDSKDAAVTIVAIFGTTISPYLFFWQSAQEVEDIALNPDAEPLIDTPSQAAAEFKRIRLDTWLGMAMSNIVAIAIMIGTAATLHGAGTMSIETSADAAQALEPVAGRFAFLLFSIGIVGTGLLAVPVLAGSAAYAVSEACGWSASLERRPKEAVGFYAVLAAATVLGIVIDWSPLDPIRALFWSAVINGVVAVPLMIAMMIIVSRHKVMGKFTATPLLLMSGWLATALMGAPATALILIR